MAQPIQQAGNFSICSSDHLRIDRQKTPQELGLQPIQHYNYLAAGNILPGDRATVSENIREAQKNPKMYYFNDDNPFVVESCSNGQYIWKSVNECNDIDILILGSHLIDQHDQSIHLNAGSHGDPSGIMVSDLFTLEKRQVANLAHNAHVFNFVDLSNIQGKVSLNPLSTNNRPNYPEKANHVIYAWCFSFSTLFTSQRRYLEQTDDRGNPVPSMYKCVASQKPLTAPYYHPECRKIEGHRHYYDMDTVRKLIVQNNERLESRWQMPGRLTALERAKKAYDDSFKRPSEMLLEGLLSRDAEDYRYKFYCRLEGCTNVIDLRELKRNHGVEVGVNSYKDTAAKTNREVRWLQHRVEDQEGEISGLNERNAELIEENTGLKEQVFHLTSENEVRTAERDVAFVERDKFSIENQELREAFIADPRYQERLAQEMERLNQEPSIQEFINSNPLSKRYTPEQWNKKLTALKHEAEYWLAGILQGRLFDRVNAFISQGVSEDHEQKHREIVETLLTEIKQRVIALVRNKMHYYSTDLIDTFIIGEFQVRYNDAEFKEFLEPLMEKLIDEDLLYNRIVGITKRENVSIQELPQERWDEYEPGRWSGMTYRETMESVLSYALQIELCDQLLAANVGR